MNKTQARRLARQARQYGYGNRIYVFCPQCNERVGVETSMWDSKRPLVMLDEAVVEHLLYDCGKSATERVLPGR